MREETRIILPGIGEALASVDRLVTCVHSLTPEDTGLFGPGSVSWAIYTHSAYGISGLAALLLQALHPVAMAAIDQHSDYRRDAWRRGHRTTDYVFTIHFSACEKALEAAERVRAIHHRVSGTDPVTGRIYRADDPDLLLWIHVAATELAIRGQEMFGRPISAAEADRFVDEQRVAAGLVGLDAEHIPKDRPELRAALERVELRLTPAAAEFVRLLFAARMPLAMRPF
ncbi:MAG: oxygenase MpaB family protein [Sphingosinicella sp.]